MDYLDFSLEINTPEPGSYVVSIVESPVGKAHEEMRLPSDAHVLDKHLSELQIAILSSGAQLRAAELSREEKAVKEFGQVLFESMFRGNVRNYYTKSLEAANNQGKGLRLNLSLKSAEIASLPWEFLYDPTQEEFICLSRKTPVVRHIDPISSNLREGATPVAVPLRVFGLAPRYRGVAKLQVQKEQRLVEEAVRDLKHVEMHWFEGLSWRDLHREMERDGPWHIFHFIGHGSFDEDSDQGTIMLPGDDGEPYNMNARELSLILEGHSTTLRLAILNSCEGGRTSSKNVFSSVAATLVRRSVPVALAMQYRISDWAAIEFARSFYTFVAEGLPIEAAVAEARKSISLAFYNTVEWGTPVLFMRSPHGQIFDIRPMRQQKERREEIFDLYDEGKKYYKEHQWRKAWSYFNQIRDSVGRYRDVDVLIEDIERKEAEEEVMSSLQEAKLLADSKDWMAATEKLRGLSELYPEHDKIINLLKDIDRQKSLDEIYRTGLKHLEEGEWEEALKYFEELSLEGGGYDDVADLITRARGEIEKQRVSELYYDVARANDDEKWDVAIQKLETILSIDPTQEKAQGWLSLARHEKDMLDAYNAGLKLYRAGDLSQALKYFEALIDQRGTYKNVSALIEEIKLKEAERERERKLAIQTAIQESERLYRNGQESGSSETWTAVIEDLQALQVNHPGLDEISQKQVLAEHELFSLEQQERIAATYRDGQEHYRAGRFSKAWSCFNQIRDSVGAYKDSDVLLANAQSKRLAQYKRQLIGGSISAILLLITCVVSFILVIKNAFVPVAYLLLIFGPLALTVNLYFLYRLLRDSNNWRSEVQLLQSIQRDNSLLAERQGQNVGQGASAQSSSSSDSSDHSSPEEHLSKRLKTLCKIDAFREIDTSYITCAEYNLFINEMSKQGKYYYPDHWMEWLNLEGKAEQPISGVRYKDAVDFCQWLTEKEGKGFIYRVPSASEAIKCPAHDLTIATWCFEKGKSKLIGLPAINKLAIRKQIAALNNSSIPVPSHIINDLIVTHDLRSFNRAQASLPSALADYLGVNLQIAQDLSTQLINAVKLRFDSKDAHMIFSAIATDINIKYALVLLDAKAKSILLFDDEVLRIENKAKAREIIKELEKQSKADLVRILKLMMILLDIAGATTLAAKRHAQRTYAILVLEYAFKGYSISRKDKIKAMVSESYKSKLMRLRISHIEMNVGTKKLKAFQTSVAEFYWWIRIIAARAAGELPAWEGIRITREEPKTGKRESV